MNMSYCRFQNTLQDLKDCADYMEETDLDKEEERARKELIKVCRQIVEQDDYDSKLEFDNED